ncbi:AAA family ATPase [Arthrobacter sp. S13_S34]|nr:AAA family ATPase [Arthrobacter sp. S13_S34]
MIDPRREAVLVRRRDQSGIEDKTSEVLDYEVDGKFISITFGSTGAPRKYRYSTRNAVVLRDPFSTSVDSRTCITHQGQTMLGVTELLCFRGPGTTWWRLFFSDQAGGGYMTVNDKDVRIVRSADSAVGPYEIMGYWHDLLSHLTQDDPLRRPYTSLRAVSEHSVLDLYLRGNCPAPGEEAEEIILPFSSNLSQRDALEKALSHRISVIDGPPGTGKTQTILNLIANIIRTPGKTVGIVSATNAAVENVKDKLTREGFGHVVADLGKSELKRDFFDRQQGENVEIQTQVGSTPAVKPAAGSIHELDGRLRRLQEMDRERAAQRQELDAYRLEQRHFSRHVANHGPTPIPPLALLQGPSSRILEFLAETASVPPNERPLRGLVRRIRSRLRYGSTRKIDPSDTNVVLQLQAAFYYKKIAELEVQIADASGYLAKNDFPALEHELKDISLQALEAGLHERYARFPPQEYSGGTYRKKFASFTNSYPVVLSTCHSLRGSVPEGYLFDYLIIDEASQVDLLAAGLALSCARNVIVVGDLQQLPHIPDQDAEKRAKPAPAPSYDYGRHSILSSVIDLFGAGIPRTMLREHYRCDPAIIDFCNKKFYGGQLVPYTRSQPGTMPLVVVRTAPGNHMRQHLAGGRTNQREAEVIAQEVLAQFCVETRHEDIGVVTPYRRQVDKVAQSLRNTIQADTVHKFQGREKDIIIMSTVLDETRNGTSGVRFVDDPRLVNVAVSRAIKRFVLVTNHDMLPASRHLRDLVHFIHYQDPDDGVFESGILSVFDLLYKEYSAVLRPLAARLQTPSTFASENIMWTVLLDIVAEEPFRDLAVAPQVLLGNLLPDLSRLTAKQATFVRNRASVDFMVYNRITNRPVLAIEVDGFAFHEDDQRQKARDQLKDEICRTHGIQLLRLPTTGSGEPQLIRQRLSAATAMPNGRNQKVGLLGLEPRTLGL